MPRPKKNVLSALERKGFKKENSHHIIMCYCDVRGAKTPIRTKASHSGKDLSDWHLSQMAKQCKLSNKEFLRFVDCEMSQEEYDRLVRNDIDFPF